MKFAHRTNSSANRIYAVSTSPLPYITKKLGLYCPIPAQNFTPVYNFSSQNLLYSLSFCQVLFDKKTMKIRYFNRADFIYGFSTDFNRPGEPTIPLFISSGNQQPRPKGTGLLFLKGIGLEFNIFCPLHTCLRAEGIKPSPRIKIYRHKNKMSIGR